MSELKPPKPPCVHVYAVVRYNAYLADVASGLSLFTVKEIVHELETARQEVQRLNDLAGDDGTVYGWQTTRLYPPGRAAGPTDPTRDEA